jgi:hypothetical protein
MTIIRTVCAIGCGLMLVAGLGYMAVAALRRPRSTRTSAPDLDATDHLSATGVGFRAPAS